MGGYYVIAGKKIANEYLALGTLGSLGLLVWGAKKKLAGPPKDFTSEPPLNTSSAEEEAFVKEYIAKHKDDAKPSGSHH
ncbi:hypothetical protein K493DRAFT_316076 [Basidiobolus meristosporus CBS 931.73]|uniref:ATP synthase subunit K, mitochondrial n=1 Tax=Basidiobolus meristosporus CBS 931.73 TaxID=1314790 RepID=A0A1Y1Y6G0_9FUNG|nr:hypothetical protein K493DRAFT_316076 [Basidiobolus meristosporus CBS 931.73]|eukprot:ORX93296.1 hypothetical protein K493DRAFT_316076 [Basidiobolus meristosporus CBS 931.73]